MIPPEKTINNILSMTKFYLATAMATMTAINAMGANAELPYSVSPNPEIPHSGISEVRINIETDKEVLIFGYNARLNVTEPDGDEYVVSGDWVDYDVNPTTLGFIPDKPLTEPGVYHFMLDGTVLCIEDEVGNYVYLEDMEFDITVAEPYDKYAEITPIPASYAELPSKTVTLRINDAANVSLAADAAATVTSPTGEKMELALKDGTETGSIAFDMPEDLAWGTYGICIPQGAVSAAKSDGTQIELAPVFFNYTFVDTDYTLAPPAGVVYQLWTITLEYANAEQLKVLDADKITLHGPEESKEDILVKPRFNVLEVTIESNMLPDGTYTLVIDPGTIEVDGLAIDEEIRVEYRMTSAGVEVISVEGMEGDIYGLDGIVKARKAATTEGLEKGIYIKNGKKVLVR